MVKPVAEWIEKAEEDFRVATTLCRLRKNPVHNAVCFHAQQCVEKYLKAILEKKVLLFGKSMHCQFYLTNVWIHILY